MTMSNWPGWLIVVIFVGFIVLWTTQVITSGWALLAFGICWGGFVLYWLLGSVVMDIMKRR
jgi:hypothetical protein